MSKLEYTKAGNNFTQMKAGYTDYALDTHFP